MNARFWIWHCGTGGESYVKLTLRPGQTLHTYHRGPDDEGWSSRGESWTLEDGVVKNAVSTDGVDCDGRMSTYNEYECPVADLQAWTNHEGWKMPAWVSAGSSQRDYSAEAMGY